MKKAILIFLCVCLGLSLVGCGTQHEDTNVADDSALQTITDQNDLLDYDISGIDDYMKSVEEQSAVIKNSLEYEAFTQSEMNVKSQELYELWDDALNYLWGELRANLPEAEFEILLDEQLAWIEEKESAVEESGKEVEGGSVYPLVVNSTAAEITEERVYEFYTLLKELGKH